MASHVLQVCCGELKFAGWVTGGFEKAAVSGGIVDDCFHWPLPWVLFLVQCHSITLRKR